jgi:myo-inositol-1(or 4)-monophosphatase
MKEIAIKAARAAGKLLMENVGRLNADSINSKQKFDFVTDIDKQSEKLIASIIKDKFPDHKILAEETFKDRTGGYRWIIDPLDGTTNFIHAYPVFSISIALEVDGEIILGVVYDPNREELFFAEKGKGAFLNNRSIQCSNIDNPNVSLLVTGFPFRSKHYIDSYQQSFKVLFHKVSGIRRSGSVAIDFCNLAAGRCDGFWEIGLSPWDVAAGYLLISEAGGLMTDFSGGDQPVWTGNVVASNGKIHSVILNEIQNIFKGIIER